MNTLRYYYLGETGGSWGYMSEDGPVHLGSKHYATRICEERGVKCVDLTDVPAAQEEPARKSAGFLEFLVSEMS